MSRRRSTWCWPPGRKTKKKKGAGATRVYYLASAARFLGYAPEIALLLTPGLYLDLMQILTPGKEADDGD